MPKILRKLQKVFAGSASNNGQFGSAQAGTKITSNDLDVLQALPAFQNGWNSGTISGAKLPTLEEMQALQYINTSQLAYLFQDGIPEYEVGTTYYANSIVKKAGSYQLYGSVANNNTGNALTDATKWKLLIDLDSANGQLLTSTGYKPLPGGLILQWGLSGTVVSGTLTPFPLAFPNAVFTMVCSHWGTVATVNTVANANTANYGLYHNNGAGVVIAWVAIGY